MSIKKITTLVMASVIAFSFTACSSKNNSVGADATKTLEAAMKNIEKVESYNGKMGLEFEFVNNSGTLGARVDTDMAMLTNPDLRHINISTETKGQPLGKSEFYVGEDVGAKTIYMMYNDEWFKGATDDEMLYYLLGHYDMKEVTRMFLLASTKAVVAGEEDVNGVKTTKIDALIAEDVIANTLVETGVFVAAGMASLTAEHLKGAAAMPISFWIDENGNAIKFTFDAGKAYQTISDNLFATVEGQEGYEDAKKLIINKYAIDFVMSDMGKVERFDIPSEVLNAKLLDETSPTEGQPQLPQAPEGQQQAPENK